MCEPMGRREIFLTFSLLVEIEGHFTNEFVSYVYETEDCLSFQLFREILFFFAKFSILFHEIQVAKFRETK
jgi:hypothetical protein